MNCVFDVYTHGEKGQFGVSVQTGVVTLATIKADGTLTLENVSPLKLGGEVIKRVKQGYTRVVKAKYLHQRVGPDGRLLGSFEEGHPDLVVPGFELLLYSTRSMSLDLDALASDWETKLDRLFGIVPYRDGWLARARQSTMYLTAFNDHPAMALLLAQWARQNREVLLSRYGEAPAKEPSVDPLAWKDFLSNWFDKDVVQRVLEGLGWSLRDLLVANTTTQNSIIKTFPAEDNIFAMAQQASF